MLDFLQARNVIEKKLEEIRWPSGPEGLYEPIRYILSIGGKRFRPALVLIASEMYSGDYREAVNPALALEIFHNFTLLHDDIMDNAPVRRNQPTVHMKWNTNVAILSGDVMSILAFQYLTRTRKESIQELTEIFTKTAIEVCEGQQLDMQFESREQVGVEEYLQMIKLKTSVLVAACLKIGGIVGGARPEEADKLYQFGLNLGLAFQLMDDYLDLYGDPEKFGKVPGGDIIANKKTFMLIKALELAQGPTMDQLKELLYGKETLHREKVERVKALFNQMEIPAITRAEIQKFHKISLENLANLKIPGEKKKVLYEFADTLMNRDH